MPSHFTALYDACVLYPAPLRDLLVQLALTDLFRAKWSELIHDEWMRTLRQNRPDIDPKQLRRTRELMNAHARDCLVENFESLIPDLSLPDPNDRHVLAAAIAANCDVIVTFNLKDFPSETLGTYGIAAKHPDDFIADLLDLKPLKVARAVETVRKRLRNPPKTTEEYLDILLRQQLTTTVSMLRELDNEI